MAWDYVSENDLSMVASGDLSGKQFCLTTISSDNVIIPNYSAGTPSVTGVLYNKPTNGQTARTRPFGVAKVWAGGTIAAGNELTNTASATATVVASGQFINGFAITGVASGGYFTAVIGNFGYKG